MLKKTREPTMLKLPMTIDSLHKNVVAFLKKNGDIELSKIIDVSSFEISKAVRDKASYKVGFIICCRCPQRHLSTFSDVSPFGDYFHSTSHFHLQGAIEAVLPDGYDVHEIVVRTQLVEQVVNSHDETPILIESIKSLMIAVATGGPRIQDTNTKYVALKAELSPLLSRLGLEDPNPFADLWQWYGKWSDGSMPTYQKRREFISALYDSLLKVLQGKSSQSATSPEEEKTGWERVDRVWRKIQSSIEMAKNEEDFQSIGHQCREIMISVAQAVYIEDLHKPTDGIMPSKTDATRMIDAYITCVMKGSSNDEIRKHIKTTYSLTNTLQHRRTACKKDALICTEATRTIINLLRIINS